MFKFEKINDKKILKSDYLSDKTVKHFFTTRETVVTPKELTSLNNLCKQNIMDISKYLEIDPDKIIIPTQTHSDNVKVAKAGQNYPDTDALILEDTDIAILLNFADCTPVILYDNKNNVGAISHAGWRGTASSIVKKTLKLMQERYSTNPQNTTVVIGPAISIKNYQVDQNVFDELKATLDCEYSDWFTTDKTNLKYYVDLKTVNKHQLEELGVSRIDKCDYCTYDSVDVFFSYRKENGQTARHSAILKLLNK